MRRNLILMVATAAFAMVVPDPAGARERVYFDNPETGALVVRTSERALYHVLGDGTAMRYRVAVGKPGKQWYGRRFVDGKYVDPAWSPPPEVKRDNPRLPNVIAGGAPNNPMGHRALTISGGEYAIHGTNRPDSVGRYASYGCIRMLNQDIVELFETVRVGAPVIVVP